jgi:hypothetical protein
MILGEFWFGKTGGLCACSGLRMMPIFMLLLGEDVERRLMNVLADILLRIRRRVLLLNPLLFLVAGLRIFDKVVNIAEIIITESIEHRLADLVALFQIL